MTEDQRAELNIIDRTGMIKVGDRDKLPGLHFCPDWDYLPIFDMSPEKEACTCHKENTND